MDKVSVHAKRAFLSKLLIVQICCLYAIGITAKTYANNVPTFTASAPENIEAGDQFKLMFTIASPKELMDADLTGFSVSLPKELEILVGPNRSKVSQIRTSGSTYQVSYVYIVSATQAGTFSIPSASITFKGKTLRSQPLALAVSSAGQTSPGHASRPEVEAFIAMTVSERSPRVNAPVVLECKLYTTAQVDSLADMKQFISSDDFKAEAVDLRGTGWQLEHRNGKNFQTAVIRKLLLYPLRAGELRIGDLHVDAYIRKSGQPIDPFDAFFHGGGNAPTAKKSLSCQGITLHVHQ